jgi:hypothetical protein
MKKIIICGIATIAMVLVIAFNVNFSAKNSETSELVLSNIEALAQVQQPGNDTGTGAPCPGGCAQYSGSGGSAWSCSCDYRTGKCKKWGC